MLCADRLRGHGGAVGFSVVLRADWLVWLLGRLHAAGRLGGAGTAGHQTVRMKLSDEEELKAGSELEETECLIINWLHNRTTPDVVVKYLKSQQSFINGTFRGRDERIETLM